MAQFDDLPAEIVDDICARLHSPDGRSRLHSLCLTSKCHHIATPHLYHSVNAPTNLLSLVKTFVVHNTELSLLVKSLFCVGRCNLVVAPKDLELIKDNIRPGIGATDLEKPASNNPWSWYTRRLHEIIFLYCQNLEELGFVIRNCFHAEYFDYLVDKYSDGQPSLPNLRIIHVMYAINKRYGYELNDHVSLLRLPLMARIFTFGYYISEMSKDAIFPHVKELILDETGLYPDGLTSLIRCCPNLEIFYCAMGNDGREMVKLATSLQISEALLPLRNTMRMFYLHNAVYTLEEPGRYNGMPVGSLEHLNKLEVLGIWQDDLTVKIKDEKTWSQAGPFVHKLPKSLRTLYIVGTNDLLDHDLIELARSAPTQLPNLQVVKVDHEVGLGIHEVFEEAEIKLERLKDCEAELAFPCSW